MPYKKNYVGARSIRAQKVRLARRAETAEARMKRLSADRARVALMRAEENEEARAIRRRKERQSKARKRDNKVAAEASAHRADIFRRLLSAQNTDNSGKHEIENVQLNSEYTYEVAVKCEINEDDESDPNKCVET